MDPLSITVGCVSLVSTIGKTSVAISLFIRDCRSARHDLDGVSRELLSLKSVLELLEEDLSESKQVPESLGTQMQSILKNSDKVVTELDQVLEKHSGGGVQKATSWAFSGKGDAAKLKSALEAHRGALNLALDLLNV
jgi:hypothetical protein